MPVIRTKENLVVAYEFDEEDTHVQVTWLGPRELHGGTCAKQFHGPVQPIDQYQANVGWAVGIADQFQFPLHVVPLRSAEAAEMRADAYLAEVDLLSTRLTDRQRGELRRAAVAVAAETMRDCDDPHVRAAAYAVLLKLKVVRP